MAIKIPNHIGSRPIDKSIGATTGTTTYVIYIKSNIKPNINIASITIASFT